MNTIRLSVALCSIISLPLYSYADGCEYDTQCKGDRICENKQCVSPQPTKQGSSFLGAAAATKLETPPTNPPYYCCVEHEKLGPYANEGSEGKIFHVGDACSGMSRSARHVTGRVCE